MIKLQNKDVLDKFDFTHPSVWIATWGGSGFIKPASGTWGTLAGLPFGIAFMSLHPYALLAAILIILPFAYWAAKEFSKDAGENDSSMIVVDEVIGMWITLLPAALNPVSIILSFVLFRIFDIWKPRPIAWIDQKFKGAFGVIADDMMAGIFAALCVIGLKYAGLG